MDGNDVLLLGLGLQAPWKLVDQHLDVDKSPHELHLTVEAERGERYPCPECGEMCKAHDFKEETWRHLNFFQHHCYIHARVPRVNCSEHGIKRAQVPWARKGSAFTLLFEQAALTLVREMPVLAAARIMEVTDKRLWRVVHHYVAKALEQFDLSGLTAFAVDETSAKRGQDYVSVFIDMQSREEPVRFVTPGNGKETIKAFKAFLEEHGGCAERVRETVCDMSGAFHAGIREHFANASITVDWFHVVQRFNNALNDVRKTESRTVKMPKGARWGTLKRAEGELTTNQLYALSAILEQGLETGTAWHIKEKLRWVRQAKSEQAAKWRLSRFLNYATPLVEGAKLLAPMGKALKMLRRHREQIIRRWHSTYTNARLEGFNGLFQAARARARGYRFRETFIAMIYLIASPARSILKST